MRRRALVLLFVVLTIALFACKKKVPKAGDLCTKEGDFTCASNTKRMVCTKGKYIEETCTECTQKKGFNSSSYSYAGCVAGGVGPEGAACPAEDSVDCDGTDLVKCTNGTYHHFKCGGSGACKHTLTGVSCDATIGNEGEACREDGDAACSPDKQSMLHCKSGKLVKDRTCKGPNGCVVEPKVGSKFNLECDITMGDPGDPCGSGGACSTDKSEIVVCKDGKYVVSQKCRGTDPHCNREGDRVRCAGPGVSEVGDPCTNGAACSPDGKAFLDCKNGAYAQTSKCKSCKLVGTEIICKH